METREIIDAIAVLAQVLLSNGANIDKNTWYGSTEETCNAANKKIVELIEKLKPNGQGN